MPGTGLHPQAVARVASALSFFFVIIVPLLSNDEPNVSLIQTP
jgi:hypothetical protein